jgi:glyoxylase-like metal-dependent hydrolase (beta-lactamase superfamily II)
MADLAFQPITPHIYKLDLPFMWNRFPVGVWLVQDERGWVMVDAGAPGYEQKVIEQVLAHTGGRPPYALVLTHGHVDHAAAAGRIRTLWRIPIAAGRLEAPYLTGAAHYSRIPAHHWLYRWTQISAPPLPGRNVHLPLDDGGRIGPLEVCAAAGHAPGMVALLHAGDRALLCADAFFNVGGKLGDPSPLFTYDPALNHQAQARLAALDFDHLLPSHGPAIMNTGREQARAWAEQHANRRGRLARLLYGPDES